MMKVLIDPLPEAKGLGRIARFRRWRWARQFKKAMAREFKRRGMSVVVSGNEMEVKSNERPERSATN